MLPMPWRRAPSGRAREDGRRRRGRSRQRALAALGHLRLEELAHDPEGELPLELRRAGGEHT
jgi:hypothetical protein